VKVPKSRGGDEAFYPQSLERGRWSTRAVMLAGSIFHADPQFKAVYVDKWSAPLGVDRSEYFH